MIGLRSFGAASHSLFVGRIEVWRERLELGAAGVHALVDRDDAFGLAAGAEFSLRRILIRSAIRASANPIRFAERSRAGEREFNVLLFQFLPECRRSVAVGQRTAGQRWSVR